ncbi:MAG: nucleotidyltransferase family protein [Anaerolineae bacterium]|nr:nucleotidyltransferase family protein [Anaerolineae bacterium]
MIIALLLAAGTSSRYGGANKLLLPFGTSTVLGTSLNAIAQTQVGAVVAVTGHQADAVTAVLQTHTPMLPVGLVLTRNPHYREGEMVSSVQMGVRHVMQHFPQAEAVLVCLGDQPLLPVDVVNRLIAAHRQGCGGLLAPRFRGQRGHPVLIHRRYWPAVLQLPPSQNVRDILRANRHDLAFLDINDEGILLDVDTPEAYRYARQVAGVVTG